MAIAIPSASLNLPTVLELVYRISALDARLTSAITPATNTCKGN